MKKGIKWDRKLVIQILFVFVCVGLILIRPIFQWINHEELIMHQNSQSFYYENSALICIDGVDYDGAFRPGLVWWDYRLELVQHAGMILLGIFCTVKGVTGIEKKRRRRCVGTAGKAKIRRNLSNTCRNDDADCHEHFTSEGGCGGRDSK